MSSSRPGPSSPRVSASYQRRWQGCEVARVRVWGPECSSAQRLERRNRARTGAAPRIFAPPNAFSLMAPCLPPTQDSASCPRARASVAQAHRGFLPSPNPATPLAGLSWIRPRSESALARTRKRRRQMPASSRPHRPSGVERESGAVKRGSNFGTAAAETRSTKTGSP